MGQGEDNNAGAPRWAYLVRSLWVVVGACYGGWVGGAGLTSRAYNADSFGSMLASGGAALFALAGAAIGVAAASALGWDVERAIRSRGGSIGMALLSATVLTGWGLWGLGHEMKRAYPGLAGHERKVDPREKPKESVEGTCKGAKPPRGGKDWAAWEMECK